jgi:hypothetical protein
MNDMKWAKPLSRLFALLVIGYALVVAAITWYYKPTLGRSLFGGIEIQQPNATTRISAHDLNCTQADLDFACDTVIESKHIVLTGTNTRNPMRQGEYDCVVVVDGVRSTCALSLITYTAAYARMSNAFLNFSEQTLTAYRARNPLMHMSEPEIMRWLYPFQYLVGVAIFCFLWCHIEGPRLMRGAFAIWFAATAYLPIGFFILFTVRDFVD